MKKLFNKLLFTKIMHLKVGEIWDLLTTYSPVEQHCTEKSQEFVEIRQDFPPSINSYRMDH